MACDNFVLIEVFVFIVEFCLFCVAAIRMDTVADALNQRAGCMDIQGSSRSRAEMAMESMRSGLMRRRSWYVPMAMRIMRRARCAEVGAPIRRM